MLLGNPTLKSLTISIGKSVVYRCSYTESPSFPQRARMGFPCLTLQLQQLAGERERRPVTRVSCWALGG